MPNVTKFHPRRNETPWRQEVKTYLTNFECVFSFQKTDGSVRKMTCTLQENVVPETKGSRKTEDIEQITVFDTDVKGWRTIKYDKIIDFKVQNEYVRSVN